MERPKRRRSDRRNADSGEEDSSRKNQKSSKLVGDTGSSSGVVVKKEGVVIKKEEHEGVVAKKEEHQQVVVKKEEDQGVVVKKEEHQAQDVLGKDRARLLAEKGFCITPFMHDGVSDAVNQLLGEGGPCDIFFSMDSAMALCAAEKVKEEEEEEEEEGKKNKKKGGCTRRGFWQSGPRRSVMRMVIGEELPGAKALQPNATGGHKAAAARAVAQQMQAAIQRAGEAMRGMAEAALREIAQELGGEDVMHLVDTYGSGGSTVQAILTVSMISGEVEEEKESVADCGMHTDRGLLTLVCSREGKGLSVRAHENSTSTWTDDAEHKDMVTVLGGHLLERVSLGRAKAAEHAVFSRGGERLSVALTLRPAEGQSVRVNGAVVAAEDVMGELVGSVNEPKSGEERHSQENDPEGDGREESGGSETSEDEVTSKDEVASKYDTIKISFRYGGMAVTFSNVRRTTKFETLSKIFCRKVGSDLDELRFLGNLVRMRLDSEIGSYFDFNEPEEIVDVLPFQVGD